MPHRTVPSLSGAVFLRNEKMFREAVGDAAVERAHASLTDEERAVLESAVPAAWIPVAVVDTFYCVTYRGTDDGAVYRVLWQA